MIYVRKRKCSICRAIVVYNSVEKTVECKCGIETNIEINKPDPLIWCEL